MTNSSHAKFAVVAGASSGIGLDLNKEFARNGFDLLIVSESNGIDTAAQSLKPNGASVEGLQADLASYEGVGQLYSAIKSSG